MNEVFPFGFPTATGLYLTLYVATLALHVAFMSYVLAGSSYLALRALGRREAPRPGSAAYRVSDWLPFTVGLAITAGVAPLLFLQILYEHRFYTANLLLFHRWMLIVPALIAGFYLLYLAKSDFGRAKPWRFRVASVSAFACFAFTAWSWTENHLLSRDEGAWVQVFTSGQLVYRSAEVLPRLAMWFLGTGAVFGLILAWQLRLGAERGDVVEPAEHRLAASIGLGGLVGGGLGAAIYATAMPEVARAILTSPLARPYAIATALAGLVLAASYGWLLRQRDGDRRALWAGTVAVVVALLGSGVLRESLRLAVVPIERHYAQHAAAFEAQGLPLFLAFLVGNGVVIAFALRLGAIASRRDPKEVEP
ncbi:MAG: hypothetical protein KC731_32740 [Myxococcales bacterium]|nr:hypothetical protein [Myxococcales bacterium]